MVETKSVAGAKKIPHFSKKNFLIILVLILAIFLTLFSMQFQQDIRDRAAGLTESSSIYDLPVRGSEADLWADIVLGQPDFNQGIPGEVVDFKIDAPGGVIVDRTVRPNRVYIYDGLNSRILGYRSLGVCQANSSTSCTSDSDCGNSICLIQLQGENSIKHPDIVIGQPGMNTSACNGDSTHNTVPPPQIPPASRSTLCFDSPNNPSPAEGGSFASMAVDPSGNLYVGDYINNRVLKYNQPFTEDTNADEVWGQNNFSGNECNKSGAADATTLCFPIRQDFDNTNNSSLAGADIDFQGNLWIADIDNNRVLRFSKVNGVIQKSAGLVLGQSSFLDISSGNSTRKFRKPAAVRVASNGKVYVADSDNNRVMVFEPPYSNGMDGQVFSSNVLKPTGIEFALDNSGIFVMDTNNKRIVLFDWNGNISKTIDQAGDARGSLGITSDGDIIVANSDGIQNVRFYSHPVASGGQYTFKAAFYSPPEGRNYLSNRGLMSPRGLAVTDDQLIIADAQRLMYWNIPNGISDLENQNGKAASGVAGVADFKTYIDPHYNRISYDNKGNLWALRNEGYIERFALPLTYGEMPVQRIRYTQLKILGQTSYLNENLRSYFSDIYADPDSKYLWLSLTDNDRVIRIRIPENYSGDYIIDGIIGGSDIPVTRASWHRQCDVNTVELCSPGALTEDKEHNIYIINYGLENEGNARFYRFDHSLFPLANQSLLTYTTNSASQTFNNMTNWGLAFSPTGQLVTGGAAFTSKQSIVEVFNSITSKPNGNMTSDRILSDYYAQGYTSIFDRFSNLYIADMNHGRVLIYKKPFGPYTPPVISPTPTSTPHPTSTIAPNTTTLDVELFLHGVGSSGDNINQNKNDFSNKNPIHTERSFKIFLYNKANQLLVSKTVSAVYDSNKGTFTSRIVISESLTGGNYITKIKIDRYLEASISGTIEKGKINTLKPAALIAGDINGDNKIDILDFNILNDCGYSAVIPLPVTDSKSVFKSQACQSHSGKENADLNDNGTIEPADYNLFIRELN